MNEIIKQNELRPASFLKQIVAKDNGGVELIVKLLIDSVEQSKSVTVEDIIECYLDFTFRNGRKEVLRRGFDCTWTYYSEVTVTREKMRSKRWYVESNAVRWFKNKLGEAILKGRLIAIPVIELNSDQNVQPSDTTDPDSSTTDDKQKNL